MSTISKSQKSFISRNTSVIAGINKRITGSVTVGGVVYTPAQLNAVFQAQTTAFQTSQASHKQWQNDVLAAQAASKAADAVYASLHSYLVGQYGKTAVAVLADFGMNAPKTAAPTVVTKAVAAVKRTATRTARHTMGTVQKKGVKGDVMGVVLTPITSAPVPTATSAPASPTASGTAPLTTTTPASPTSSTPGGATPTATAMHSS